METSLLFQNVKYYFLTGRNLHHNYVHNEDFIENNSADQGKLFRAVKSLLSETKTLSLPAGLDSEVAANDIGLYFVRKVQNIQDNLSSSAEPDESFEPPSERCHTDSFAQFNQLTMDDVRDIILRSAKKSCKLDPIPTSMVIHCMNELLPVITSMVNMCLQSGYFAEEWKEALVHPLPKKCGLDFDFKNLRPVSNLQFISKLTESAVADQTQAYMSHHRLYPVLQSAYRKHHTTETALLRVHNDILMSMNKQHVTLLVLLDLSAVFDTVNHDILFSRLQSRLGVNGAVLSWFELYLSGRSQRVYVNG